MSLEEILETIRQDKSEVVSERRSSCVCSTNLLPRSASSPPSPASSPPPPPSPRPTSKGPVPNCCLLNYCRDANRSFLWSKQEGDRILLFPPYSLLPGAQCPAHGHELCAGMIEDISHAEAGGGGGGEVLPSPSIAPSTTTKKASVMESAPIILEDSLVEVPHEGNGMLAHDDERVLEEGGVYAPSGRRIRRQGGAAGAGERSRLIDALSSNIGDHYDDIYSRWCKLWRNLSDKKQMRFKWPLHTPLEVHELVGRERFDSSNPKYYIPLFWKLKSVPATPSWALIVCMIEMGFGMFCFWMNVIHFAIYLPGWPEKGIPLFVFFVTLFQLSVFFCFKYATCVFLLLDASFALSADYGGFDEQVIYCDRNPLLIRIVAFASLVFFVVQIALRMMTVQVYNFLNDTRIFRTALYNCNWRYRKKIFFSYCSIQHEEMKIEQDRKLIEDEFTRVRRETEERFRDMQHKHNVTQIAIAVEGEEQANPWLRKQVELDQFLPHPPDGIVSGAEDITLPKPNRKRNHRRRMVGIGEGGGRGAAAGRSASSSRGVRFASKPMRTVGSTHSLSAASHTPSSVDASGDAVPSPTPPSILIHFPEDGGAPSAWPPNCTSSRLSGGSQLAPVALSRRTSNASPSSSRRHSFRQTTPSPSKQPPAPAWPASSSTRAASINPSELEISTSLNDDLPRGSSPSPRKQSMAAQSPIIVTPRESFGGFAIFKSVGGGVPVSVSIAEEGVRIEPVALRPADTTLLVERESPVPNHVPAPVEVAALPPTIPGGRKRTVSLSGAPTMISPSSSRKATLAGVPLLGNQETLQDTLDESSPAMGGATTIFPNGPPPHSIRSIEFLHEGKSPHKKKELDLFYRPRNH